MNDIDENRKSTDWIKNYRVHILVLGGSVVFMMVWAVLEILVGGSLYSELPFIIAAGIGYAFTGAIYYYLKN